MSGRNQTAQQRGREPRRSSLPALEKSPSSQSPNSRRYCQVRPNTSVQISPIMNLNKSSSQQKSPTRRPSNRLPLSTMDTKSTSPSNKKNCVTSQTLEANTEGAICLPPSRSSRYSFCSSTTITMTNVEDKIIRRQCRSLSQPPEESGIGYPKTISNKKRETTIKNSISKNCNPKHLSKTVANPISVQTSELNQGQSQSKVVSSLNLVLEQNQLKQGKQNYIGPQKVTCANLQSPNQNRFDIPNNKLHKDCLNNKLLKSNSDLKNSSSPVLYSSNNTLSKSSLSSIPDSVFNENDSKRDSKSNALCLPLASSSSSPSIAISEPLERNNSEKDYRLISSCSSGCIPSSISNSSTSSSVTSMSSTALHLMQEGLQDSSWAARAASIALSLTRVHPTIPPFNPRRSISPPPHNSPPQSPYFYQSRNSISTPPSPHHSTNRRSMLSTPSSPLLSNPRHSVSFPLPLDSSYSYLPHPSSPNQSRPPSPTMPRALSPRRNSSPAHSLPASPNLRPRSGQRPRSQRTPSPRPPLPPSSTHDPAPPIGQGARSRNRVESGGPVNSKMRGR